MATKESLQELYDAAQHQIDHGKSLQLSVKRLNAAKKDEEIQKQREALMQFIETVNKDLRGYHSKINSTHQELSTFFEAENASDDSYSADEEVEEEGEDDSTKDKKRLPAPEDQEIAYQLKARMMPQIYNQNTNLKAELVLMNRRNFLRAQRKNKQLNYNRDTNLSAVTTLKAIQLYQKKAKAAEEKVEELEYEVEMLNGGEESGRKTADRRTVTTTSDSLIGNNHLNDVVRKNEILRNLNQDQKSDIQRLKKHNAELMQIAKEAQHNRHQYLTQLSTSEKNRRDLHTRLQRQKAEHTKLSKSLARQSNDWIESRKEHLQSEDEWRWKQVGYASPHGGRERTMSHHIARKTDQPRMMYPVADYAQTAVC